MHLDSYKELVVWQKAMDLVIVIYEVTDALPAIERYGLISQMRRAAVSIPSNIAEGRRRGSRKEFRQFLAIAFGSGSELETQLEIIRRLPFRKDVDVSSANALLGEIMRMLNKMISTLQATS